MSEERSDLGYEKKQQIFSGITSNVVANGLQPVRDNAYNCCNCEFLG
jgi:hypothetical protein